MDHASIACFRVGKISRLSKESFLPSSHPPRKKLITYNNNLDNNYNNIDIIASIREEIRMKFGDLNNGKKYIDTTYSNSIINNPSNNMANVITAFKAGKSQSVSNIVRTAFIGKKTVDLTDVLNNNHNNNSNNNNNNNNNLNSSESNNQR